MFNFQIDKKTIYILLIILLLLTLRNFTIYSLLIVLPAVIIAITFHEFAHAFAADKLGDDTPRMQGRLNLNPISHIDPMGFILLMFAGFGWGKPVQINSRNFNRNIKLDKAEAIVALAGPVMNFIMAVVFSIIFVTIKRFTSLSEVSLISLLVEQSIIINIGLGVFNLLPFPPLDGSKIFVPLFSYKTKRWLYENEQIFYYIFIFIWITGLAGIIVEPITKWIYYGLLNGVFSIFGLF